MKNITETLIGDHCQAKTASGLFFKLTFSLICLTHKEELVTVSDKLCHAQLASHVNIMGKLMNS